LIEIRELTPADYEAVFNLWRTADGVVIRDADRPEAIAYYLERNPGSSFVAVAGQRIVGAVLCGHDGRRGYLHHLVVDAAHRRQGIGRALVERALAALEAVGIRKCHLMVLPDNTAARRFYAAIGWVERPDVMLMSHLAGGSPNT
jgi:ribosomal protein S18 acetylase RimI-like enzyme